MPSWAWFVVGAAGGFALAHAGGTISGGLSFGVGSGKMGKPRGSTLIPLDQPEGSTAYQTIGAYNPLYGGNYSELPDNDAAGRIVNGGSVH